MNYAEGASANSTRLALNSARGLINISASGAVKNARAQSTGTECGFVRERRKQNDFSVNRRNVRRRVHRRRDNGNSLLWKGGSVMAYIPSGTIKAYMGIKSIVKECFFDKNKRPYVEVSKLNNTVSVLIYREEGKPIVHSIRISDIEYLKQVYDQLYQMAFRRK